MSDAYKVQIGHHSLEGPSFPRHLHENENDAGKIRPQHKEDHSKVQVPGARERVILDVGLARTCMKPLEVDYARLAGVEATTPLDADASDDTSE